MILPLEPCKALTGSSFQEPRVVRSSVGRLRVHLPRWSGNCGEVIEAHIHSLAGVTLAEANPRTRNVLILFEPEATSVRALLAALPSVRLDVPVGPSRRSVATNQRLVRLTTTEDTPAPLAPSALLESEGTVQYVTGIWRVAYLVFGWASVGMAVVGAILPGIPTAPFVILAGYFFIRSSPSAHQWLRRSRWFGAILRDWEAHRGVRLSIRNAALILITASMVITLFLGLPTIVTASIVIMQVAGLIVVSRLRVVEPVHLVPTVS